MIGILAGIGVTTKTNKRVITDHHIFHNHYNIQERERELIKSRWSDIPLDQVAVMNSKQASEYLGVTRMTLTRWHERGVLTAIVNPRNRHRRYLLGHLWVFKVLLLENERAG